MKRFVYIVLAVAALAFVAEQAQAHGRSQFRGRSGFRNRGASFSLNFGGGYGGNSAAFRAQLNDHCN